MKTTVSNFLWVIISIMLMVIHLFLALNINNIDLLPYMIGVGITAIIAIISFKRMSVLMQADSYRKIILSTIKKWWVMVYFIFIFIFLFNTLFFLNQLFLDENSISRKVALDGNYWNGCLLSFIVAVFATTFLIYWTRIMMMKIKVN